MHTSDSPLLPCWISSMGCRAKEWLGQWSQLPHPLQTVTCSPAVRGEISFSSGPFFMCYIHTCMLHMWASATFHNPVQTLLGIKSTVTINKITISYWGIPIIAVFPWLGRSSFIYRPQGEWTFFSAFRFMLLCICILHSLTMCVERAEAVSVSFGLFSAYLLILFLRRHLWNTSNCLNNYKCIKYNTEVLGNARNEVSFTVLIWSHLL